MFILIIPHNIYRLNKVNSVFKFNIKKNNSITLINNVNKEKKNIDDTDKYWYNSNLKKWKPLMHNFHTMLIIRLKKINLSTYKYVSSSSVKLTVPIFFNNNNIENKKNIKVIKENQM